MRQYKHNNKKLKDFDYISKMMYKVHTFYTTRVDTAIKNFETIPKNATITLEWVKCGKRGCRKCSQNEYYHKYYHEHYPHGPYYFAYWREKNYKGKLKKKYIGEYDPRVPTVKKLQNDLRKNNNLFATIGNSTE